MNLYLDTSQANEIIVGVGEKRYSTEARQEKSQKLLPFIVECMEKHNIEWKDLTEVEINLGPGSFTGLRVGVSVANTLFWTLGIPLNERNVLVEPNY